MLRRLLIPLLGFFFALQYGTLGTPTCARRCLTSLQRRSIMTDRDRLNPPSPGLDVPPPDSITQEMRTRAWSRAVRDGETAVWPMLAIARRHARQQLHCQRLHQQPRAAGEREIGSFHPRLPAHRRHSRPRACNYLTRASFAISHQDLGVQRALTFRVGACAYGNFASPPISATSRIS